MDKTPINIAKRIHTILQSSKTIAVVGISDKAHRPSYGVTRYMMNAGYEIFPVNPKMDTIFDQRCYANLSMIGKPVDVVNIFRLPEYTPAIVEEAIQIGAKTIWMQLGVVNTEAARLAQQAGLQVVMDRCIKIEHNLAFNW